MMFLIKCSWKSLSIVSDENLTIGFENGFIEYSFSDLENPLKGNPQKIMVDAEQKIAELSSINKNLTEDLTKSQTDKVWP